MIIYRYSISISDGIKSLRLSPEARIVAVAAIDDETIEFWAEMATDEDVRNLRTFKLVGTGQWYDSNWTHRATAPRTPLGLVWYLIEWATPERTTARAPR